MEYTTNDWIVLFTIVCVFLFISNAYWLASSKSKNRGTKRRYSSTVKKQARRKTSRAGKRMRVYKRAYKQAKRVIKNAK